MDAIRSMHADFCDLPDDTRYNASANSSNKIKILEEEVTNDDSKQSLQTISPILSSVGKDTQRINQKALKCAGLKTRLFCLQSDSNQGKALSTN
jgi:hypothetical protein